MEMGNGWARADEVSRRLDWKTKSSLELDFRTMAGLYTGGTVPILTKQTMETIAKHNGV